MFSCLLFRSLDVTALYDTAKRRGIKFFAAFLHCLSAEVNARREFRMSENERGELGWYDTVDPCYTVFHEKDERFSDIWTQIDADFKVFYARYLEDAKKLRRAEYAGGKAVCGEEFIQRVLHAVGKFYRVCAESAQKYALFLAHLYHRKIF